MTYHNISGWFDFDDIYKEAVERAPNPARFCEVGNWMGKSLTYLATEIVMSGKSINLWSVDSLQTVALAYREDTEIQKALKHQGQSIRDVLTENLKPCLDRGLSWAHMCLDSVLAAREFPDKYFDFVFIDADHTYESVLADILAWKPKVKPGGQIGGHDHTSSFPGVERACREVFGNRYKVIRSSWVVDL